MLYPTELSSGGRTGFEPVANGMRRCSASELPSARGTPSPDPRHTPRQRRAHRMGLANPCRCGPFERCSALAPPTFYRKRQSVCDCIRLPPVPKHPGTAHPCAFAVFPCLGPAMPGCFGSAMQSRLIVRWILCERRKRNAPGCWNPRAFAWPREIGVTDLRDARDQSMVVVPKVFRSAGR